ncbi:hypothetical protein KJ705_00615, partial [Patescibacteria group bacterium]|nr:hypothetical protein [Patescibacteria group bacterium]
MFVPVKGAKETMHFMQLVLPLLTRLDGYTDLITMGEKQRCKSVAKKRIIIIGREDGKAMVTCQSEGWKQTVTMTTAFGVTIDKLIAVTRKRILAACEHSKTVEVKLDGKTQKKRKKAGGESAKPTKLGDGSIAEQAYQVLLQLCPDGGTRRFKVADIVGKVNELDDSRTWPPIIIRWLKKAGHIEETGKMVGGK